MAQPGWYPDPAGTPGHFRYWDGQSWAESATERPSLAAASAPTGAPTFTGPPRGQRSRRPWWIAAAALFAAFLVFVGWRLTRPVETAAAGTPSSTSAPTGTAWDQTPIASSGLSASASSSASGCPVSLTKADIPQKSDGLLRAGHVGVKPIPGWSIHNSITMGWAAQVVEQDSQVEAGWYANIWLGALATADGFTDVQKATTVFLGCYASSDFYTGITATKVVWSKATTVSGHPGWAVRAEVRVNFEKNPAVKGDVIDIIVVDTGDPKYLSFFVGNAPIGDSATQKSVDAARATLIAGK